ncbi:hypothetical protein [Xanthobacter aminoxidans]|uniref:hypothetical protein n=1 Tax=Xanthobacter aminoxidans TaxID=186280 RepID=UPI00372A3D70
MRDSEWNAGVVGAAGIVFGMTLAASYNASAGNGEIRANDWLQFFGTLLGASATILAGAIAWFAARKQIFHKEDAAKGVIDAKLRSYIESINVTWIAIEKAVEMESVEYIEVAERCLWNVVSPHNQMIIGEIKALSMEAGASDRDYISSILGFHAVVKECADRQKMFKEKSNTFAREANLKSLIYIFADMFFIVGKYSEELAAIVGSKGGDGERAAYKMTEQSLKQMWGSIERRRR